MSTVAKGIIYQEYGGIEEMHQLNDYFAGSGGPK